MRFGESGERGPAADGDRVDVVVLTALGVEYRAVREPLRGLRTVSARGSWFELGGFRDGPVERRVAIHMTGPGNPQAAVSAERSVALFAPRALLFVGVAGGRKDVALGDVVAADVVYDYETGKDTEAGFLPRQKTHHSAYSLVQLAQLVAADGTWRRRLPGASADGPRAHVKPIAAGGRVVGHQLSEVGRRLAGSAGDAVAVDMEGFGFLAGAHVNEEVPALVVRGISDLLDDKGEAHDERWQPIASHHAAAFAYEVISRLPAAVPEPAPPHPAAVRTTASAPAAPPVATSVSTAAPVAPGAPPTSATPVTPAAPVSMAAPSTARRTRPGRLSVAELTLLTDGLLAIRDLTAPATWQLLLDALPTMGTAVGRHGASRPEALSLLRTCEDYGAWVELVEGVLLIAPRSPAAARFAALVTELGLG
ncbi:effector-associated domain 2-containing protein [Streptomyces sp. SAJ15]|uniref:phosphorylase family protein n=1 Tax=Streptomyces sp. SAJ15 TaxID=2011095 RepID=UPI001642CBDD|nr:5'-methylthioadenosine/S-adenosylhomocysteine nucleosidase [Streptomyces sp. SAJ15]